MLRGLGNYLFGSNDNRVLKQTEKNQIEEKYKPFSCKHGELTYDLFTVIAEKSVGSCPGSIGEKEHGNKNSTRTEKSRYLMKPGTDLGNYVPSEVSNSHSLVNRKAKLGAILEFVAICFYGLLSLDKYKIPKTKLANMPWINDYTKDHELIKLAIEAVNRNRAENDKLDSGVHLLSKMVKGYSDMNKARVRDNDGSIINFMSYVEKYSGIPETIWHEEEEIDLIGLVEILAIGKLLHDIDVAGYGNNVGFVIEEAGDGKKIARAVKIDPGFAFYVDEINCFLAKERIAMFKRNNIPVSSNYRALDDQRDIQIRAAGNVIRWIKLTPNQQGDFMFAMGCAIHKLKTEGLLEYMFTRDGQFTKKFGTCIKPSDINYLVEIIKHNLEKQTETYAINSQTYKYEKYTNGDEYYGEFKDGKKCGRGIYTWANGDRYIGKFKNGKRDGRGVLTCANSGKYEGEWQNDNMHGNGIYIYATGEIYEGEWQNGKCWNGKGAYKYANGDKYDGEWQGGEKHGRGIWIGTNGDRYEGEFKNGKRHGRGVLIYANGDNYEGEWQNGEPWSGKGAFKYANGDKYDGEWQGGEKHGRGIWIGTNGDEYYGEFKDGKKCGRGIYTCANSGKYKGEWQNDNMHGNGIYTYATGEIYEGEWRNGERWNGNGAYKYANGDKYDGEWRNGKRWNGKDAYKYANGDKYDGEWQGSEKYGHHGIWIGTNGDRYEGEYKDEKRHGRGIYTYTNGDKYEGEWVNGNRHGQGVLTYANGDKYVGKWLHDSMYGEGTYIDSMGETYRVYWRNDDEGEYEGEWLGGKKHGHGIWIGMNGDRYEGECKDGKKHGRGIYTWANGDKYYNEWLDVKERSIDYRGTIGRLTGEYDENFWAKNGGAHIEGWLGLYLDDGDGFPMYIYGIQYEGEWLDDRKHGQGIWMGINGDKFEGRWLYGKKNGWGVYTYANNFSLRQIKGKKLKGCWRNDLVFDSKWLDGKPPLNKCFDDNKQVRYKGERNKDGKEHGRGICIYANGYKYEGEWVNGERHGRGVLTYANGDKYDGEWKGGEKHGYGIWIGKNGDKYEGGYKDGKEHGWGVLTYANGDKYEGEWLGGLRWNNRGMQKYANGYTH